MSTQKSPCARFVDISEIAFYIANTDRVINMTGNNIGERIRARRLQLRITQEELALKTGYTDRSTINKIEKSSRGLSQDKITIFARALNTSEAYLLGLVDDPGWRMRSKEEVDFAATIKDDERVLIERYRAADDEKKRLIAYLLGLEK